MSLRRYSDKPHFDWITFSIYLSLVLIGALSLYSVLYDKDNPYSFFDFNTELGRYTLFIGISLLLFFISYMIDWNFWYTFSYPIYILSILLLIGVLIFGVEIKGAKSWFSVYGFSFQPSEFAKLGTALAISSYLSSYKVSLENIKNVFIAFSIFLLPVFLILLQPDAGSALIFFSLLILFYRAGFNMLFYIILALLIGTFIATLVYNPVFVTIAALVLGLSIVIFLYYQKMILYPGLLMVVATAIYFYYIGYKYLVILGLSIIFLFATIYNWLQKRDNSIFLIPLTVVFVTILSFATNFSFYNILKPHQQERINVWLNPEKCDPRGSLYNVLQSQTAIGSGGVTGKGYLKGTMTHLNFVPEQSTDFIFSSIGEEQGFIGVLSVIVLYMLLIIRVFMIGERGKTRFIRYYAYALGGYIFIHFFMNVGMNMGLLPVIGIPLIFISKGGTSLVIFSIMMGILLRMDSIRSVR